MTSLALSHWCMYCFGQIDHKYDTIRHDTSKLAYTTNKTRDNNKHVDIHVGLHLAWWLSGGVRCLRFGRSLVRIPLQPPRLYYIILYYIILYYIILYYIILYYII